MKHLNKLLALGLALLLACSLFAGCTKEDDSEGETDTRNWAEAGGSISWPEGFDTSERLTTTEKDGTLYASFNGVQSRTSGYFRPAGDTITVTGQATTESEKRKTWRVTLWKETTGAREYVDGGTLYLTADGSCYTGTFSGLDAGSRYKIGIAYDGGSYYLSGGVTVSGLQTEAAA